MDISKNSAWLYPSRKWVESVFILLPPYLVSVIVIVFSSYFVHAEEVSVLWWVLLVLLIDVAHVYSTLYRTYLDPKTWSALPWHLKLIPLFVWLLGIFLYTIHALLFWRLMAYLAVFHFVRQQYGFLKLYSRKDRQGALFWGFDVWMVYCATLYPILFWHFSPEQRKFDWFVEYDFYLYPSAALTFFLSVLYYLSVSLWLLKEFWCYWRFRSLNVPRVAIIIGTILSWYIGIVYFNGDLSFTLLNVVSHGVPYMALVWIYKQKELSALSFNYSLVDRLFRSRFAVIIFLFSLFFLAYFEEALWDGLVWQEHYDVFGVLATSFSVDDTVFFWLVPLLSVPQLTHYVLDAFIWKSKYFKKAVSD